MTAPNQASVLAAVDPECCGEPMVHYPAAGWECASAYFALLDDGVVDPNGCWPLRLTDRATRGQRELLAHVDETRITEPLS